jgi:hypothetical protein
MTVNIVIIFVTIVTILFKYNSIQRVLFKMVNDIKVQKLKHIVISYKNFERLRKFGFANDSMNDVITKILEKKSNFYVG